MCVCLHVSLCVWCVVAFFWYQYWLYFRQVLWLQIHATSLQVTELGCWNKIIRPPLCSAIPADHTVPHKCLNLTMKEQREQTQQACTCAHEFIPHHKNPTKHKLYTYLCGVRWVGQVHLILVQPVVQDVSQLHLGVRQQRRLANVVSIHAARTPSPTQPVPLPSTQSPWRHLKGICHRHGGGCCCRRCCWRSGWDGRVGAGGRGGFRHQPLVLAWLRHDGAAAFVSPTCVAAAAGRVGQFRSASLRRFPTVRPRTSPSPSRFHVDTGPGRTAGARVVGLFQSEVHCRAPFLAQNLHRSQQLVPVCRFVHFDRVQIILADLLTHLQVVVPVIHERLRVVDQIERAEPVFDDVVSFSHCATDDSAWRLSQKCRAVSSSAGRLTRISRTHALAIYSASKHNLSISTPEPRLAITEAYITDTGWRADHRYSERERLVARHSSGLSNADWLTSLAVSVRAQLYQSWRCRGIPLLAGIPSAAPHVLAVVYATHSPSPPPPPFR